MLANYTKVYKSTGGNFTTFQYSSGNDIVAGRITWFRYGLLGVRTLYIDNWNMQVAVVTLGLLQIHTLPL
jgi:hypothetical protein